MTRWNDFKKNIKKREKKVDKILAKKRNLLYNIIIKLKKERLIILYEGRENLPTKKTKERLKTFFISLPSYKVITQNEKYRVKFYRGLGIIPIGKLLLPRAHVIKDEGYFYEVELTEKGSQKAENERETDKEYKYQSEENEALEDESEAKLEVEKEEEKNRKRAWFSNKTDGVAVT